MTQPEIATSVQAHKAVQTPDSIPTAYLYHCSSLSFPLDSMKSQLALMTFRVIGKQFISFKKNKGNINITRSLSKMPWGKFSLWLYSLLFPTSFFFFPSPCQAVRTPLISETCLFSFGDSDRAPTCNHETTPQELIPSFKSKISPCALSVGSRRIPAQKTDLIQKCKCARISMGL